MDVFVEYLVKKKRTVRDNLITVSILLCVVLLPLACCALAQLTGIYYLIMVGFFCADCCNLWRVVSDHQPKCGV